MSEKWHNIATRLDDDERLELERYRAEHGLRSLNGAVRHWLQERIEARASGGKITIDPKTGMYVDATGKFV